MVTWAVVFTVGAVIQTATETSLAQMIIGRFVAGLSVGALSGLCPLYLGETAPKAIRGMMVSGYQLLIITGIAVSYGISWGSSNAVNSSGEHAVSHGRSVTRLLTRTPPAHQPRGVSRSASRCSGVSP